LIFLQILHSLHSLHRLHFQERRKNNNKIDNISPKIAIFSNKHPCFPKKEDIRLSDFTKTTQKLTLDNNCIE
jgi:hypothetical protein